MVTEIEKSTSKFHFYKNKIILAPMVKIGTLPTRLLSLDFGADLVYSEELIDHRLLKCRRIENCILGTVDYVDEDNNVVFRTCERERDRLVLQIGSCDPERALQVSLKLQNDVSAIDLNMGCPKEFSLKGGIGAALLTQPEKVDQILRNLVNGLDRPVSCKIRVLPTMEKTLELAELIERAGACAIAVHGRTKEERQKHPNRNDVIKAIASAISIPVIANGASGEIETYEDIQKFRNETKASSVMIARQAEWNSSIFRKDGKLPIDDVIKAYLRYAILYDNHFSNTKYCIQQMLGSLVESERGRTFLAVQQMEDICDLWGMADQYREMQENLKDKAAKLRKLENLDENPLKKRKVDNIWVMEAKYIKCLFNPDQYPKTTLINWTRNNKYKQPVYNTFPIEKKFSSIVTVNGQKYSSSYFEKNKKNSEQAAALVALFALNLVDPSKIKGASLGNFGHKKLV